MRARAGSGVSPGEAAGRVLGSGSVSPCPDEGSAVPTSWLCPDGGKGGGGLLGVLDRESIPGAAGDEGSHPAAGSRTLGREESSSPFLPRPIISIFPLPRSLAPRNAALARSDGVELSAGAALPVPRTDAGSEGSGSPMASVAGHALGCGPARCCCFPTSSWAAAHPAAMGWALGGTPRRAALP